MKICNYCKLEFIRLDRHEPYCKDNPNRSLRSLTNYRHSEEAKAKISKGNKGKKRTKSHLAKLSKALKGRTAWNKGKKCPNLSKAKTGVPRPDMRGNKFRNGYVPWNKGIAKTEEEKKHLSLIKAKLYSEGKIKPSHSQRRKHRDILVDSNYEAIFYDYFTDHCPGCKIKRYADKPLFYKWNNKDRYWTPDFIITDIRNNEYIIEVKGYDRRPSKSKAKALAYPDVVWYQEKEMKEIIKYLGNI